MTAIIEFIQTNIDHVLYFVTVFPAGIGLLSYFYVQDSKELEINE